MSIRMLSSLNSPPLVLATGCAITVAFPFLPVGNLSLGVLKALNILAFATNVAAVSVPGRLDGQQDAKMRSGDLNPSSPTTTATSSSNTTETTPLADSETNQGDADGAGGGDPRQRSLVLPAGWAFAIWGPIYLGEAIFCIAQLVDDSLLLSSSLSSAIPKMAGPFIAANLVQSLWCAAFRPSYNNGWHKYVSVVMLGGTAYSLSRLPTGDLSPSLFFIPMVMHFGWTTAATLVNFNGSLSMEDKRIIPDYAMVAAGHASVVIATALGVSLTVFEVSTPVYSLTIGWALAAVASGIKKIKSHEHHWSDALITGAKVQKALSWTGSILCVAAFVFTTAMSF